MGLLATAAIDFQRISQTIGNSTRHERNMDSPSTLTMMVGKTKFFFRSAEERERIKTAVDDIVRCIRRNARTDRARDILDAARLRL